MVLETIIHDDDDNETVSNEETDGIPMFDGVFGSAPGGAWYSNLAQGNRNSGSIFTIFCVNRGGMVQSPGAQPTWFVGSFANNIDTTALFAVVSKNASLDTYAHEIGHLLGLNHTWIEGTEYSEAKLPDDARGRVMCYDRTGRRLVKPERDAIHTQIKALSE